MGGKGNGNGEKQKKEGREGGEDMVRRDVVEVVWGKLSSRL